VGTGAEKNGKVKQNISGRRGGKRRTQWLWLHSPIILIFWPSINKKMGGGRKKKKKDNQHGGTVHQPRVGVLHALCQYLEGKGGGNGKVVDVKDDL